MGDAQPCSDPILPHNFFPERPLRGCTSRKRDNVVLIEVDTDDFGELIILDVPDSFPEKFRKRPKNVISIDDDDDDGGGGGVNGDGGCHTNSDATTSDRCSPAEGAGPSRSAYVNEDVNEGNTPVKLTKSKRTYSGKSVPGNRYGLNDSEGFSSDGDCSDCEVVEGSFGKLREQWEKASFKRRHNSNSVRPDFQNKASSSAPTNIVHDDAEESCSEDVEPLVRQSSVPEYSLHKDPDNAFSDPSHKNPDNAFSGPSHKDLDNAFSDSSHKDPDNAFSHSPQTSSHESPEQVYDPMETDEQPARTCDNIRSGLVDEGGTFEPECPLHNSAEQSISRNSEPMFDLNHSAGKLDEQSKLPRQNCDVFRRDDSAEVTDEPSQDMERDNAALLDGQLAQAPSMLLDVKNVSSHTNDGVLSCDQNNVIIDRQQFKETEVYKHAMEEELVARQQQLLLQAEEAKRLRTRKKAEKMRLMMNERRQKERLEEMRQTQRKDEENSNLKEKYRIAVKKELNIIEAMCGDMASLLRCLGINVGGGPFPSPNEVQAAYKRACLKFHPDRISATDLRQQVEAEEKFKLISNMKDKLMSR